MLIPVPFSVYASSEAVKVNICDAEGVGVGVGAGVGVGVGVTVPDSIHPKNAYSYALPVIVEGDFSIRYLAFGATGLLLTSLSFIHGEPDPVFKLRAVLKLMRVST